MLIFGRTNDDKGAQLEALTTALLVRLGFTDITVNEIGSGGEELDVTAERVTQNLGASDRLALLGECKANKTPLGMTDWLKFLGKVFTREAQHSGRPVTARLIALGGVNGNVLGHYRALRELRPTIQVVSGDDLLAEARAAFGACTPEDARAAVDRATARGVRDIDLGYFDGRAYWVARLEGDVAALLHADGRPAEPDVLDALRPLVVGALAVTDVVDLAAEALARDRALEAEQFLVCRVMLDGGATRPPAWQEPAQGTSHVGADPFTTAEVARAGDALVARGWLRRTADAEGFEFVGGEGGVDHAALRDADAFLLGGAVGRLILDALWSPWHQAQVTEGFVRHLLDQQGAVPLNAAELTEARQVVAWSPSALRWLVYPQEFLVTLMGQTAGRSREEAPGLAVLDRTAAAYVMHHLLDGLARDGTHPHLCMRFAEQFGVAEVERQNRVIVKGSIGPLLDARFGERLAFGRVDLEAFGAGSGTPLVAIRPQDGAPEPWERWPAGEDPGDAAPTGSVADGATAEGA